LFRFEMVVGTLSELEGFSTDIVEVERKKKED
jgi:hypothetical protein